MLGEFLGKCPQNFAMCVRWTVRNSEIENCAIFGQNVWKIHQHQQYKELLYAQLQGFIFRKDTWFSVKPILGLSQLCAKHVISIFSWKSSKNLLLFSEMVFCIIQRKLVLFWGRLHILWADGTQSKWRNFPCFGAQSAALKSAIFHFSLRRAIWMKRNILRWIQVKFKFKSLNSKVEQILISAISDYRS